MNLNQITNKEQIELKKVYFDSIQSIDEKIYSKEQKSAWSSQVWKNNDFDKCLKEGKGWFFSDNEQTIAFAIRYPDNHISLLYCRGNSQRRGLGTLLINQLESEALKEGISKITTDASLISYGLFLKQKWKILEKEKILINHVSFERYKMIKYIKKI